MIVAFNFLQDIPSQMTTSMEEIWISTSKSRCLYVYNHVIEPLYKGTPLIRNGIPKMRTPHYSGTPLKRTPLGLKVLSFIARCP